MAVSLGNISRTDSKNTPGYSELYAAYEKDVSVIPPPTSGDVATAITMVAGKVFVKIEFDGENGCFSMTEEQDGDGQYGQFRTTVQGHIAGNNAVLKNSIDGYVGVPLILVGKRKEDGVKEILGEVGAGIILKFKQNTAGRAGNASGWDFTGNQDYNHLPYDYSDGTITL
jgi:hypothetical protein